MQNQVRHVKLPWRFSSWTIHEIKVERSSYTRAKSITRELKETTFGKARLKNKLCNLQMNTRHGETTVRFCASYIVEVPRIPVSICPQSIIKSGYILKGIQKWLFNGMLQPFQTFYTKIKRKCRRKSFVNREIKHHVLRQTANVSLHSIFFTFPPIG